MIVKSTLTPSSGGDTITLSECFNYKLYIPEKRFKVKQTSKGTFTEISVPRILDGTQGIEWTYEIIEGPEATEIETAYKLEDTFIFTGAYGESYLISFDKLDLNHYRGGFKSSGFFRVLCVISEAEYCTNE